MKRSKFTDEQIPAIVKEGEAGRTSRWTLRSTRSQTAARFGR
jgi:hypothetical protein